MTVGGSSYSYDGDGNRVTKNDGGGTTLYWPSGVMGVVDVSNATATSFGLQVFLDGLRIWSEDVSGTGRFLFQDQLGSTRVTASAAGQVEDDIDYRSFGEIVANYGAAPSDNSYVFTGYQSDSADSSTDYARFRNLEYAMARFNRPDPYLGSYDFSNPQSFNRYAYVMNNPLTGVDPAGLDPASCDPSDPSSCPNTGSSGPDQTQANSSADSSSSPGGGDYSPGTVLQDQYGNFYVVNTDGSISPYAGQGVNVNGGEDGCDMQSNACQAQLEMSQGQPSPQAQAPNNANPINPCSTANPNNLDYSTTNAQQHILQNHTPGGKGPSFYVGDWTAISLFNQATLTQGSLAPAQFQRAGTYTLQWSAPQLWWPLNLIWTNNIGWGANGQPTPTNRLVVKTNCSTVITSYPVN